MKKRIVLCILATSIAWLAIPVLAQTAPVANIYVQTTPGVMVYNAAANGTLTLVKGSPFKVTGQMEDINGKYLISVGDTYLHVYSIASNGAVGGQVSQINTASYGGSECGGTSGQGSVLDHNGQYLYVQLNTLNKCAAWQTYRLESNGYLQFLGDVESYQLYFQTYEDEGNQVIASTVPTISSSDKFQYGVFNLSASTGDFCPSNGEQCPNFSAFKSSSAGAMEKNASFSEKDPVAQSGYRFIPWSWNSPRADNNGHLAVLMDQVDDTGGYSYTRLQLASYTINPTTGAISSTNTYSNMPILQSGWYSEDDEYIDNPFAMAMSPAGNLLAVATPDWNGAGIQLFHFNGAAPPTAFGNLFYEWSIDQMMWDSHNHLYALQYQLHRLQVFTITPTSVTQTGSPYNLPVSPYGTKGLIVVSK
jgi:hypothetical protein